MLMNYECKGEDQCKSSIFKRYFEINNDIDKYLETLFIDELNQRAVNTLYSGFFDFKEDGQLDLMIVVQEGEKIKIKAIYSNIHSDNFFLKHYG